MPDGAGMTAAERRSMLTFVTERLIEEQKFRPLYHDWVERERMAVVRAVNECAMIYGLNTIAVAEVERIESRAMGHIDYTTKLALYACELAWGDA